MLLRAQDIEIAFSNRPVLRGANISVSAGECVGLIGNNGSGKSTLLKILSGDIRPDHGTIERHAPPGLLQQDAVLPGETVGDALRDAQSWHAELLDTYQEAINNDDLDRAGAIQDRLDTLGWDVSHHIDAVSGRLGTPDADTPIANLSGGQRRRVALARALLCSPDLLLLDEPTNHLDSEAIDWLQGFLAGYRGAVVLVTHDRYLLEASADRIVEVEDGLTIAYNGSYGDYLIQRAERRARLEKAEIRRVATLAREAAWASRSPAARSTKQRARLKRLDDLREERPLLKEQTLSIDLRTGFRGGQSMIELVEASGGYDGVPLFEKLTTSIQAKSCVGVLGPNGVGKSTLFKLICKELEPLSGDLHWAPRLKLAVIDQARSGLRENDTLLDAAGNGASHVTVGEQDVHVAGYLRRFLFRREQLEQRVSSLSGGERMRLLLAKLMLEGANVLLLDEPTNDLDLMTLRVLEESLMTFDGATLVISHDRALLDRVCTAVLSFEGDGRVVRYASRMQAVRALEARQVSVEKTASAPKRPKTPKEQPAQLSRKEQRELDALPEKLEGLEAELEAVETTLGDPETYRTRAADVDTLNARLTELEAAIASAYARWEALESMR